MANVVPFSFAQELLKGTHDFTTNTIKLALYTAGSGAPYSTSDTAYSSGVANEVSGAGYTTGGNTLSSPVVANQNNVGVDQVRMQYPNLTPLCKDTGAGPHSDTDRADNPGDGREKTSHMAIATMTA